MSQPQDTRILGRRRFGRQPPPAIHEGFIEVGVAPERMDALWRQGWRHFGMQFARYSYRQWQGRRLAVFPLRIALDQFQPSKSQRRILRRNADLDVSIQPAASGPEEERLFQQHRVRFQSHQPEALENFLGEAPELYPCELVEFSARLAGQLVAASYLDVGRRSVYSVYGMFSPSQARRSLGICTMLWEIHHARQRGCRYYYLGYVFGEPTVLDYKLQFTGLQWYDWHRTWRALARRTGRGRGVME